jgi:hypothetical protein
LREVVKRPKKIHVGGVASQVHYWLQKRNAKSSETALREVVKRPKKIHVGGVASQVGFTPSRRVALAARFSSLISCSMSPPLRETSATLEQYRSDSRALYPQTTLVGHRVIEAKLSTTGFKNAMPNRPKLL